MALLSFSEVAKYYGQQDVLKNVTMSINLGERIGLVGRNGAGKTTLIRLILAAEAPDGGLISKAKGLRVAYLPQELMSFSGQTLLDMVLDVAKEFIRVEKELELVNQEISKKAQEVESFSKEEELEELVWRQGQLIHLFEFLGGWSKEAEAKKILGGLGFLESDFERNISEFSGGWMMRAVLARLLLSSPDILLLDEPTNHLDLDSLLWLEEYLKTANSSLLLVSHDRYFLNNVCSKIVELSNGEAHSYLGNYNNYLIEREKRLVTELAAFENQQDLIKHHERFIERNRARASSARRAQSRVKSLEKMDILDAPENFSSETFRFSLPTPKRGPDLVVEINGLDKNYGDISVFQDLNMILRRGDRLALVGANGRGKSTLAKLLLGLEDPSKGEVSIGPGVETGYFAQFQLENMNPNNNLLEELMTVGGDLTQGNLRSMLGSFLFPGDDVFKKISVLSGGEKARLVLAKIMLTAPNFLILDEPTNHLDIQGRQMLEEALRKFPGTICFISHDRQLINALATKVGIIEDKKLIIYPGNYADYLAVWQNKEKELNFKNDLSATATEVKTIGSAAQRATRKREDAEARQELSEKRRPLEKKIKKLEKQLDKLSSRERELNLLMSDPKTYQDSILAQELSIEFADLKENLKKTEMDWEKNMLALESLDNFYDG